jgi:hypothetical protein
MLESRNHIYLELYYLREITGVLRFELCVWLVVRLIVLSLLILGSA